MVKYFKLTSGDNQFSEFVFGTDSFILKIRYNYANERYYADVYKNGVLVLRAHKLVWSSYNIFNSYKYKNIGSLSLISDASDSVDNSKTSVLQELNASNITKFIFKWEYGD